METNKLLGPDFRWICYDSYDRFLVRIVIYIYIYVVKFKNSFILKPVKFRNYHLQKLCTIQELLSNLAHVEQVIFNR